MKEERGSVDHRKIGPAVKQQRIGRTQRTAGLYRNRSQPAGYGSVNMAAGNHQRLSVHCIQGAEKRTVILASDLIQRLYADLEWWLMHEQKDGGRHIGKRARQPVQMGKDVAVALTGHRNIETTEDQPIDGCAEMHRSRRSGPCADSGKFGSHQERIIAVARQ